MNPIPTLRALAAAALVLAPLALLPPALAAQARAAAWHEVMHGDDGTSVSIDSAHVSLTSGAGFIVRTAVRFPQPMQLESGAQIDREVDLEELDCDSTRIRGIESRLLFDTATVRRVLLSRAWEPVAENRRPLFDARCAWLVHAFDVSAPADYELVDLEEQPELANRNEVAHEMSRVYPRELRDAGSGGLVILRMRVLEDGTVDEPTITIQAATVPGFAEGAVQAVQKMRFRPARVNHRPVKVWVTLPMAFSMQASEVEVGSVQTRQGQPQYAPEVIQRADPRPPPLPPSRRP